MLNYLSRLTWQSRGMVGGRCDGAFDGPAGQATRDFAVAQEPEGTILVQLRPGIWGMSAKMNRIAVCIAVACLASVACPVAAAPDTVGC
jgi:hypothetical protein